MSTAQKKRLPRRGDARGRVYSGAGQESVFPGPVCCPVFRHPLLTLFVIIQHLLELLMIQSDKLAYLTDLSGSRGRTSGETALSAHSEEHEVF